MIKIFRKIRQKMIKENRVSNYFLDAIGEIVLVVIGIFIALQLNLTVKAVFEGGYLEQTSKSASIGKTFKY